MRLRRHAGDLVLVEDEHRCVVQLQRAIAIFLGANPPALFGFGGLPGERVSHDLVAEADAEHRLAQIPQALQEGDQALHPLAVLIAAVPRAAEQITVVLARIGQCFAADRRDIGEAGFRQRRGDPAFDHLWIGAEVFAQVVRHQAVLDDAQTQRLVGLHAHVLLRALKGCRESVWPRPAPRRPAARRWRHRAGRARPPVRRPTRGACRR
ncbi:hypothetical protein D3C80_1208470 [compost metagenome]